MIDYEKVSVIGRINRFFGQVDVAELNSFSDMVHALWLQHVKQGWALYLYTDDVSLGVIFLKQHCLIKKRCILTALLL